MRSIWTSFLTVPDFPLWNDTNSCLSLSAFSQTTWYRKLHHCVLIMSTVNKPTPTFQQLTILNLKLCLYWHVVWVPRDFRQLFSYFAISYLYSTSFPWNSESFPSLLPLPHPLCLDSTANSSFSLSLLLAIPLLALISVLGICCFQETNPTLSKGVL